MDRPFRVGDLVEYAGPETHHTNACPGEYGRLVTPEAGGDPPPEWVVDFDRVIGVYSASDLRPVELDFEVRRVDPTGVDRARIAEFLEERATARVARLGELINATEQEALIAEKDGRIVGVLTYIVEGDACEVLTLHVAERWVGIGSALLREVERLARAAGRRRVWLITTNDNLDALRFYQRRNFNLAALHVGGIVRDRKVKPEIPAIGEYGIFIHDELELEKRLRL
ncbi:MAG TPA: GNAT family N-acetyltransferase [Actinomycetota bacterium]